MINPGGTKYYGCGLIDNDGRWHDDGRCDFEANYVCEQQGESILTAVADPGGGVPGAPPLATNSFSISCSFGLTFDQFVSRHPHRRVSAPSEKIPYPPLNCIMIQI